MREISIALKLEVVGSDNIPIPGCEPEASFTSSSLSHLRLCKSTYAKLDVALAAIPGSTIEWQVNNGESNGSRKKWFVLPPHNQDCPCDPIPDYYAILRSLASMGQVQQQVDSCAVLDQGWCPLKNINQEPPPPVKRYVPEGEIFGITPSLLYGPYYFGNDGHVGDDIPLSM